MPRRAASTEILEALLTGKRFIAYPLHVIAADRDMQELLSNVETEALVKALKAADDALRGIADVRTSENPYGLPGRGYRIMSSVRSRSKRTALFATSVSGEPAMLEESNMWALVLAAGEGSRLRALTTSPSGRAVPKQFCSLHHGPSLLQEALCRAQSVVSEPHTCAVVAEQHRCWWQGPLSSLQKENVTVQPQNRGTANGILLPLLRILSRDPEARLVLLPSDHHVRQERLLKSSLREALEQLEWRHHDSLLLGIRPDDVDPDLGYIVPGPSDGRGALTVAQFVEKPPLAVARELVRAGGLWNAFIVVSTAHALLDLFRKRIPEIVRAMRVALQRDREADCGGAAIAELYERLPVIDFSRDILPGQESELRALPVPPCGWSDLGTPARVAEALRRSPRPEVTPNVRAGRGYLSLAEQHQLARTACPLSL